MPADVETEQRYAANGGAGRSDVAAHARVGVVDGVDSAREFSRLLARRSVTRRRQREGGEGEKEPLPRGDSAATACVR
jgi:hypothetical protein